MGFIKNLICLLFVFIASNNLLAQTRTPSYSVVQAGGLFGLDNQVGEAQNGYQFQFIFGKNYWDRTFVGLGVANEVFRVKPLPSISSSKSGKINTLPIFADIRQQILPVSPLGNLGAFANAGYALGLGGNFYRGWMGKAGLTYSHLLIGGSDLQFSVGYGVQQFEHRFLLKPYTKPHVFITLGLFSY
jgi:hypothetical protein